MIEVTAAIIVSEGKILIAQKESTHKLAGLWEFPGGKMEPNETPQQCLQREILEELGLEVEVTESYAQCTYNLQTTVLHLRAFRAKIVGGMLTLHEHDDARWVYPYELTQYDFVPSDQYFVDKLISEY